MFSLHIRSFKDLKDLNYYTTLPIQILLYFTSYPHQIFLPAHAPYVNQYFLNIFQGVLSQTRFPALEHPFLAVPKQERMFENWKRMLENRIGFSKLEKSMFQYKKSCHFVQKVCKSAIAHRTPKTSCTHAHRTHITKNLSARTSAPHFNF